jgi:hypothetical protein
VVVNLAIEDQGNAALPVAHRLAAAGAVNDGETGVPKGAVETFIYEIGYTAVIRASEPL